MIQELSVWFLLVKGISVAARSALLLRLMKFVMCRAEELAELRKYYKNVELSLYLDQREQIANLVVRCIFLLAVLSLLVRPSSRVTSCSNNINHLIY